MRFVDREDELKLLTDHLTRPGAGMFVLYGRRRIGKTALLHRAIGSLPRTAYHVGTRSTPTEEMRRLSETLAAAWSIPLLAAQPLASFAALLALLEGIDGPAVLVLDELPYLLESEPALPGMLQAAWDQALSRSQLKLVLCGSSVGMMENAFFSPGSPLFGRRTGQLRLGPLAPQHLAGVFDWSLPEIIELAALFGGVPGYLQRLDPTLDLATNLRRHVLTRGEPLYEEVPFLLREELREPRVYNAILASIAAGARKFSELSSKVGLDRANLTRYLGVLAGLGLVEREVPVTERQPEKSRKGLYRIADPFVATSFAFVHPFRDELERGLADQVMASRVAPQLHIYLSRAVEPVLRDLFLAGFAAEDVPFRPFLGGRHWSPTAELDLVLLEETRRHAFIAELKWAAEAVSTALLDGLRDRVAREPAFAGVECTFALVSRAGFAGSRKLAADERLIDLSLALETRAPGSSPQSARHRG
ncbi:MAG: ATP-binding protein [Acidobacteriota bacterium]